MVRLVDIAKRAGVSLGSASAVLSGRSKSNIRVSREKTERILAIAREMNYIPNFSAQMLCGHSSHTLGVLIDSEDVAVRFRQIAAIEREADSRGYRLLIAETHDNPGKQLQNCRTLFQYGVDAVICHVNTIDDDLKKLDKVIFYGAEPLPNLPSVYYDISRGYAEAATQFRQEKRRNPALLIGEQETKYDSLQARRKAFLSEYPDRESAVFTIPNPDNSRESVRRIFSRFIDEAVIPNGIDALIVQNDIWCLALASELLRRGKRIPEDISLVGQDNAEFSCCLYPALSTIDTNLNEFGKSVIELTLERILHPETPVRSIAVPTALILRETTQPRRNE
jgi:transcriptional regulator, lacI family